MIEEIAENANIEPNEYDAKVVMDDDVGSAILARIQSYDTVCVGFSEQRSVSRILFGSLAERIATQADRNVATIRGPYEIHRTVCEALVERLSE